MQLQLPDMTIRKECDAVSMDAVTRAQLIDLMARVVVAVFREEGGSNDRSRIQSKGHCHVNFGRTTRGIVPRPCADHVVCWAHVS